MAEKYTEAQKRATLKYMDKTVAIQIRVTSEQREHYRELANSRGISLAKFIIDALDAEVQRGKLHESCAGNSYLFAKPGFDE